MSRSRKAEIALQLTVANPAPLERANTGKASLSDVPSANRACPERRPATVVVRLSHPLLEGCIFG
jgi:hypothetical protein